jgi:hypothetical protein
MPAVQIRQGFWNDLVIAAETKRRKPETLANQALQDFLQRTADEELLSRPICTPCVVSGGRYRRANSSLSSQEVSCLWMRRTTAQVDCRFRRVALWSGLW